MRFIRRKKSARRNATTMLKLTADQIHEKVKLNKILQVLNGQQTRYKFLLSGNEIFRIEN
jgi:hypothetical protein